MTDDELDAGEPQGRDRVETVLLLGLWVLPLLAAAGLLVRIGLAWLAGALLAVEVTAGLLVARARRQPERPARTTTRPWLVPVALLGVLLALLAVTLLAARVG